MVEPRGNFIGSLHSDVTSEVLDILNVRSKASHNRAIAVMGALMDEIGDVATHPAHAFMEMLADAIARYEAKIYPPVNAWPVETLKYLMDAQGVKQMDLADIFGSQGNVSQVLQGKRELNLGHIRKLAERFNVDPTVFI